MFETGVIISGINLIRLISRPIQAMGQDVAETDTRMPRDINIRKSELAGGNQDITYNDRAHIFTLKG